MWWTNREEEKENQNTLEQLRNFVESLRNNGQILRASMSQLQEKIDKMETAADELEVSIARAIAEKNGKVAKVKFSEIWENWKKENDIKDL
jgi:hypothetical protein